MLMTMKDGINYWNQNILEVFNIRKHKSNEGLDRFKCEKPKLYLTIGIPGSGKTSFRRKDCITLCRDDLRFMFLNTEQTQNDFEIELESMVEEIHYDIFVRLLKSRMNVYLDSTNLSREKRKKYFDKAYKEEYQIIVIQFNNIDEAKIFNKMRERTVPNNEMKRMIEEFDPITTDEIEEFQLELEIINRVNNK